MTDRICSNPGCSEPQVRASKCLEHAREYMREYHRRRNGYYDKVTCDVDGCRCKPKAGGLCSEHVPRRARTRTDHCTVADCGAPTRAGCYCESHYHKRRKGQVDCETWGCLRIGNQDGWCYEHEPDVIRYKDCVGCGVLMAEPTRWSSKARRYCSESCCDRDHRRIYRRLRRAPGGDHIRDRDVYVRDNWRCGLCHRVIHQHLSYPHPGSASLDHVLPLSRGGAHTLSNVQAAHLRCNVSKLDGVWGEAEQLRLIA